MEKNFNKKVLENGMTILFEKREAPVVSVGFAIKNGGINESLNEKGISHFIEHMLYKGTKKRNAKKIAEEIELNGGDLNGFTNEEMTVFHCKVPSKHLDIALDVLSDIIKNSVFDKKELDKERKVIFEEIKMRKDNPQIHVYDEIQKTLYTGTLSIDLIGTVETMSSIDRRKVFERFKQIYTPNNLILCAVGNADFGGIIKFAEKTFGREKGEIPKHEFGLKKEEKIEKRKGLDQAHLILASHIPIDEKNCWTATVLMTLMGEGMSSRLFHEIREKRNLVYSIHGSVNFSKNFAYNFVYAGTMKEKVSEVKKLILKEFEKTAKELTEKELKRIKERLAGNFYISMEDSHHQMVHLLYSEIIHGEAGKFYDFEKNISKVKLNDVKKMASEMKEGNYSFFALVPED